MAIHHEMLNRELDILYVKELKTHLVLKDLRSVKRWCRLNGVTILKDYGRRSAYVMRSEFEASRLKQFICLLKERHGKNWINAYHAHVDFNIELLSAVQDASRVNSSERINNVSSLEYTNSYQKSFLEKINSL